ncbi:branched-chain amino acid ABC transporter permease [Marinivivus vitaminiproducens]|uniref:branched-chain amino acid ABC transporter permease n=1 Tax=Marinivivus vitaminiproducens TaxID=3035935 RepID=UPI00279AB3C9|nr:branched-chain amino acid ABC transporter permease [Geminicoccaceae bacterium SCSIO 64248]
MQSVADTRARSRSVAPPSPIEPARPVPLWQRKDVVIPLAVLALLVAAPGFLNSYHIHVLTLILIYVPCALGQNLITGNSGQLSMGHAAFFGLGAYVVAILTVHYGWPAFPALVMAAAAAGVVGLMIGLPAIRISGDYLFLVTIGVNLVFLDVVTQWISVTGGTAGIPGLPMPSFLGIQVRTKAEYFYMALVVALLCLGLTLAITKARFGKMIEAVRDDPIAAASCGVSLTLVRVSVFVIGAAMAGLAGGVLAFFIGFVGPSDFNVQQSLLIFEMAILGGLGSVWGSIVGAALLVGLPEMLRFLQPYRLGLLGLVMILLMIYRPQGLLGSVKITNLIRK